MSFTSEYRSQLPAANQAAPDTSPLQAGAGQQAPASSLLQTDAVPLGQTGGSGSLHSESGDTAQDRLRGSGTSCDPSSEERRRDEASRDSLSEQNEARSDPKMHVPEATIGWHLMQALQSRRLNQNRLAARKSRQRRKEYVEDLEEQVKNLSAELSQVRSAKGGRAAMARGLPAGLPSPVTCQAPAEAPGAAQWQPAAVPNPFHMSRRVMHSVPARTSPSLGPATGLHGSTTQPLSIVVPNVQTAFESASRGVLHAFERWHAQHTAKVRTLLEAQEAAGQAEVLAQPIASVITHLADLFRLKQSVLQGPEAHAVLSLQHLPEAQRRFAPLGILSCADVCAGLMHKLAPSLDPPHAMLLEQTRNAIMGEEAQLHVVLSGTMAEVTQIVAQLRVPLGLGVPLPPYLASPDMQAKLNIMCDVFMAADRLWEQFLQHSEQFLTLHQFVTVVCSLAETGAGLEQVWLGPARPDATPAATAVPQPLHLPTCQAPLT